LSWINRDIDKKEVLNNRSIISLDGRGNLCLRVKTNILMDINLEN
jgi:hypothetical protein